MAKTLEINEKSLAQIEKSIDKRYSQGVINTIIKTSFPTLESVEQAVVAFQVATEYQLDPKMKEMYAWVDNRGNMVCIASAAGFMKIARRQHGFIKIEAHAVYDGEEFSMDTGTGEVSHKINPSKRTNKKPVGAYAKLEMEGKKPQVKYVNWADYYVKKKYDSPWDKQGDAMIEKCPTTVLLRQAFGLSGLYGEEETDAIRGKGKDVSNDVTEEDKEDLSKKMEEREAALLKKDKVEEEIIDAEEVKEEVKEVKEVKNEKVS